ELGPGWREVVLPLSRFVDAKGHSPASWQVLDKLEIRGKAARRDPPRFARLRWIDPRASASNDGGVSGALNEGSLGPTITSSDDNWLFRPSPDPACDGRPEPLLLSKPCLPGLRPTGSGQLDRLRPLWQTATPSAVLQDLQGSLLRTQGHAPVR